jgi:hypothetical protein
MRRLLTITCLLTLSSVTAFGQFWNKSDAQYTFHWTAYFSGNYLGFKQLTADSDTLIDGNLYTRYHDYSVSYLGGTNSFDSAYFDTTSVLTDMAFFEEDSVLYAHHLNSYNDQIDTLYNFGALPGESWTIPQFYLDGGGWSYNCDSLITVNVLDTGHITYQGQQLYFLKVNYLGSSAYQMLETDTIFERFGSKQVSFLSVHDFCVLNAPFNDSGSPFNLTCYSDNEISLGQDCSVLNVYTSVEEIEKTAPTIYPNPAWQSIVVQTISNRIHLTDLSGRNLLSVAVKNGQVEIDISSLANGTYFIRADNGNATKLIVKK